MALEWEKLAFVGPGLDPTSDTVTRAKIPGGWLVYVWAELRATGGGPALTFVPDPDHEWDGSSVD